MSNLLASGFSRLFKSKIFYISLAFFIVLGIFLVIPALNFTYILDIGTDVMPTVFADSINFNLTFWAIVSSVFIGLFIGREFSDGTVVNKLAAGYSRTAIYTSNLIVCFTAQIIMQIAYIFILTIPYIFILNTQYKESIGYVDYSTPAKDIVIDIVIMYLIGLCIIAVYTAIYVFITTLLCSKSRAITISLITAIALILLGEAVAQNLYQTEYSTAADDAYTEYYFENLESIEEDSTIESSYKEYLNSIRGKELSGAKRSIYLFLDDFLPTRQVFYFIPTRQVFDFIPAPLKGVNMEATFDIPDRAVRYVLYDFGIVIVTTTLGIFIFNKKDLRCGA